MTTDGAVASNGTSNGTAIAPQTKIALSGKVIAITGANRGIGLGIANSCLSNGADQVFSIDVGETGDDFAAVQKLYPSRLHAIKADVTKEETITAAVDQIIEQAGGLHGVVANAGRTKHKPALDFTTEEIDQLWSINLYGSFYTARAAARAFIKQNVKGSIVFTASMASYRPNKRVPSAPYGASKAGVRNMTHTLAMEWAQYNIRVNSVSPGLVNTAMTYWVPQQPDWEQQLKYYGGMPRLAEVEELGGAYVYLLSDAASYTTSIDIPVNGVIGSADDLAAFSETFLTSDHSLCHETHSPLRGVISEILLVVREHGPTRKPARMFPEPQTSSANFTSSSSTKEPGIMSASFVRPTASRAVHLRFTPRPSSLGESREILRLISQFGEVEHFKNLKYDALSAPNTAIVIFREAEAASHCIKKSPIRFRMGPAEQSQDPDTTVEGLRLFQIQANTARINFRDQLNSSHFHGNFAIDGKSVAQQDLNHRVPMKGLSDVNWQAVDKPWDIVSREKANHGAFKTSGKRKSLQEIASEAASSSV
ncbi:hypothetical protein LTR86_007053 [Recurvomyces mirabilis]|nr:hypothetical protein LTR86_007053 [Recurvomyces mirabilis]